MGGPKEKPGAGGRRLSALFVGRVQGVGFRITTAQLAQGFSVRGYVLNTMEGDVRLVAEGVEADVLAFWDALKSSPVYRYVRQEQVAWSPATGEFLSFEIRYA